MARSGLPPPGLPDAGPSSSAAWLRSFFEGIGVMQPDAEIDLIKRIIGLPGETVELRGGVTYINGIPLRGAVRAARDPRLPADGRARGLPIRDGRQPHELAGQPVLAGLRAALENVVGRAFVVLFPFSHATLALDADYALAGEGREEDDVGATGATSATGGDQPDRPLRRPSRNRRRADRSHRTDGRLNRRRNSLTLASLLRAQADP